MVHSFGFSLPPLLFMTIAAMAITTTMTSNIATMRRVLSAGAGVPQDAVGTPLAIADRRLSPTPFVAVTA